MARVAGKVAFITGAGTGIGRATAIEPTDIANMALLLPSDEFCMITGQVRPVDGGVTIP